MDEYLKKFENCKVGDRVYHSLLFDGSIGNVRRGYISNPNPSYTFYLEIKFDDTEDDLPLLTHMKYLEFDVQQTREDRFSKLMDR